MLNGPGLKLAGGPENLARVLSHGKATRGHITNGLPIHATIQHPGWPFLKLECYLVPKLCFDEPGLGLSKQSFEKARCQAGAWQRDNNLFQVSICSMPHSAPTRKLTHPARHRVLPHSPLRLPPSSRWPFLKLEFWRDYGRMSRVMSSIFSTIEAPGRCWH